jgi:hypothetical protein
MALTPAERVAALESEYARLDRAVRERELLKADPDRDPARFIDLVLQHRDAVQRLRDED